MGSEIPLALIAGCAFAEQSPVTATGEDGAAEGAGLEWRKNHLG